MAPWNVGLVYVEINLIQCSSEPRASLGGRHASSQTSNEAATVERFSSMAERIAGEWAGNRDYTTM